MKLTKRLTVNGREIPLVSEKIRLDYDAPGLALFQVRLDKPLSGEISFAMGWNVEPGLTCYFQGDIRRCITVDGMQQKLLCDEITARLDPVHPVSLRHPTLRDVLRAYSARTGISFILPYKPYADTKIPAFYGTGTGYHAMANLGAVFSVPDYFWQAQGDGRVYVGSWADSFWAGRAVTIPQEFRSRATIAGGYTLTAVPALRPGVETEDGRIRSVVFSGSEMEIICAA